MLGLDTVALICGESYAALTELVEVNLTYVRKLILRFATDILKSDRACQGIARVLVANPIEDLLCELFICCR